MLAEAGGIESDRFSRALCIPPESGDDDAVVFVDASWGPPSLSSISKLGGDSKTIESRWCLPPEGACKFCWVPPLTSFLKVFDDALRLRLLARLDVEFISVIDALSSSS